MGTEPEYLICMNCETPCYDFEWQGSKATEVMCLTCGNDDPGEFMTEADLEEMRP